MDLQFERSYPTPLWNSTLLPLLLMSLARQKHTPRTSTWINDEYDYVVVGGGAAGSVVAARLSEEPRVNVLLLEAGHQPPLLTEVPSLCICFLGTDVDWEFKTVPQKYAAYGTTNRQVYWPSGKMLGGSGNHNDMAYVRGNKKNFDDWAAQGAKGWSYEDVFPYFLKLEDNRNPEYLKNGYHAAGGPITVEQSRYFPEMKQALREGATLLGYEFLDSNGERQTGFYDSQRNTRDGQRCSSVKGYLVPAENRTNLNILLNAMVTKVIIENGKATGVQFYHEGQFRIVKARREVILSAGTINTPKILMLSGIGPREELRKWKIPVISDLPVGKNFSDHAKSLYLATLPPHTETFYESVKNPASVLEYISNRSGPLTASSIFIAFLKGQEIKPTIDFPNHSLLMGYSSKTPLKGTLKREIYKKFVGPYEGTPTFVCASQQLQPKSRGTVTLNSSDPFDPPLIDPNYLEHPSDVQDIVDGLKVCKKLLSTEPVRKLGVRLFETLIPGCEMYQGSEDEYLGCYARMITFTNCHAVGTCKMGDPDDPSTVVDPELRVKTIKGLRVVDASVMPIVPSGNIHVPTIMVAEKASDLIKESLYSSWEDPIFPEYITSNHIS